MNKNDFRYMHQGKQVGDLNPDDFLLMLPVNKHKGKTDRALLLLHGFSSSSAVFRYLIPQLKTYDAIVCPTLPGHADSIDAFAQTKSADWLSYASDVCQELFKKYKKIDVLGLSLGGLLACKLNEQFDFHHLFLLAPALKLSMNVKATLRLAQLLQRVGFKELRGAAGNLLNQEYKEISYKKIPLTTIIEMLRFVDEHSWKAPRCPVDLFLGTQDKVVSSVQVEKLFASTPNVTVHWLQNSAHVLALDNDLDQIAECINQHSAT